MDGRTEGSMSMRDFRRYAKAIISRRRSGFAGESVMIGDGIHVGKTKLLYSLPAIPGIKGKLTGAERARIRRNFTEEYDAYRAKPGRGVGFGTSSAAMRNARTKRKGFSSNASRRAAALKAWDTRGRGRKK